MTKTIDAPKKISLRYLLQNLTNFAWAWESWSNPDKGFAESMRGLTSLSSMLKSVELTTSTICFYPSDYHHNMMRVSARDATSDTCSAYSESDVRHSLAQRGVSICPCPCPTGWRCCRFLILLIFHLPSICMQYSFDTKPRANTIYCQYLIAMYKDT